MLTGHRELFLFFFLLNIKTIITIAINDRAMNKIITAVEVDVAIIMVFCGDERLGTGLRVTRGVDMTLLVVGRINVSVVE